MRLPVLPALFVAAGLLAAGPCDCIDKGDIKERLKLIKAAIKAYGDELVKIGTTTYTPAARTALQGRVNSAMAGARTPGRTLPFAKGETSNVCLVEVDPRTVSKCLEEGVRVHEQVHVNVCKTTLDLTIKAIAKDANADRFTAIHANMAVYIMEEVAGYQAEIQYLQKELARLERDCKPQPPPRPAGTTVRGMDYTEGPPPQNPSGPRPLGPPPMPKPKPMPTPKPID